MANCGAKHPKYRATSCIRIISPHPGLPHKSPYYKKLWMDWDDETTIIKPRQPQPYDKYRTGKKEVPLQSFQLLTTTPDGQEVASFAYGETPGQGCERCFKQFPPEEGYTNHQIKNTETNALYNCKRKDPEKTDQVPRQGEETSPNTGTTLPES